MPHGLNNLSSDESNQFLHIRTGHSRQLCLENLRDRLQSCRDTSEQGKGDSLSRKDVEVEPSDSTLSGCIQPFSARVNFVKKEVSKSPSPSKISRKSIMDHSARFRQRQMGLEKDRSLIDQPSELCSTQSVFPAKCRLTLCPRCTALVCEIDDKKRNKTFYYYRRPNPDLFDQCGKPSNCASLAQPNQGAQANFNCSPNNVQNERPFYQRNVIRKPCVQRHGISSILSIQTIVLAVFRNALYLGLFCSIFITCTLVQKVNVFYQICIVLLATTLLFWVILAPNSMWIYLLIN